MSTDITESNSIQEKTIGLPRSYIGAILGTVVFLIIAMISGVIKQFQLLNIGLLLPGKIIFGLVILPFISHLSINVINLFYYLFSFGSSSLPAGFIGSRLFSANNSIGIKLLLGYILYLLVVFLTGYFISGNLYFDIPS